MLPSLPSIFLVASRRIALASFLCAVVLVCIPTGFAASEGVLTGDTSRPETSTFSLGEKVELTFRVAKLESGTVTLQVSIVDEHDQPITSRDFPVRPDGSGKWETTMAAPAEKIGFYRVLAKLSNGVQLKGEGPARPGFLAYAVVPHPKHRQDFGEKGSRFGMQGGFGSWGDQVLSQLGARWVLDGSLEWRKQEPDRAGQFDAEAMIAKVAQDEKDDAGWKKYTLPTLMAAPEWAVDPDTFKYMTGALTPEGEKAWEDYCRKAARVYMAKNPERQERIYQVTWEPVPPWGFKGSDEDLIRIFEIAHGAVHEVDPKAVVAGPTQGLADADQTIPLLEKGLAKYIEAFTIHPYFSITGEREGMVDVLRRFTAAIRRTKDGPIPMLGTEQGYSTEENVNQELTQARGLLRQNLMMLGEGYRMNMAFYITDYRMAGQKGYGYYYNLEESVRFGPGRIAPRPIVPAYAVQSLLLDGHDPAQSIEWLGETAWGYAFQREDNVVLALWDYGDMPSKAVIPTGSPNVKVLNWMGSPARADVRDQEVEIELGPDPVYVTGVSAKLWGKAGTEWLSIDDGQPAGYPGSPVSIKATLRAPEAFEGTVLVAADQRLGSQPMTKKLKLSEGESESFTVDIDVPSGTAPGRYPVRMVLKDASGESVAVSGLGLKVAPPVAIVSVDPMASPNGGYQVGVVMRNDRPTAISGTLNFALRYVENTDRKVPFELAPGETKRVEIGYPASADLLPTVMHQVTVKVETSGGYAFSESKFVNFLSASRVKAKPVVDGDLRDWSGGTPVSLAGRSVLIRSPKQYSGDDDLAATIQYGWDEEALYVSVEVIDDAFSQKYSAHDTWRGDSVQLAINLDPRKVTEQTGNLLADVAERQRFSEITVARTSGGVEVFRTHSYDPNVLTLGPISDQDIKADVRTAGNKTTYEIAIPWRALGATDDDGKPESGDLVGVAAVVNDADSDAEQMPVGFGLYGGIASDKNPDRFGLLVLGESAESPR